MHLKQLNLNDINVIALKISHLLQQIGHYYHLINCFNFVISFLRSHEGTSQDEPSQSLLCRQVVRLGQHLEDRRVDQQQQREQRQ